jgi:hypothetical protein
MVIVIGRYSPSSDRLAQILAGTIAISIVIWHP